MATSNDGSSRSMARSVKSVLFVKINYLIYVIYKTPREIHCCTYLVVCVSKTVRLMHPRTPWGDGVHYLLQWRVNLFVSIFILMRIAECRCNAFVNLFLLLSNFTQAMISFLFSLCTGLGRVRGCIAYPYR